MSMGAMVRYPPTPQPGGTRLFERPRWSRDLRHAIAGGIGGMRLQTELGTTAAAIVQQEGQQTMHAVQATPPLN